MEMPQMKSRELAFGSIFLLANRLQEVMDRSAGEVTAKQWLLLAILSTLDGPPTLKELAAACNTTHQNTKQMALKLEKKGFLRIEKDATDGRALRIFATMAVERWSRETEAFQNWFLEQVFSGLSEEALSALASSQWKLYENLEKMKRGLP